MNVVVFLALLNVVGTSHALWEPLVGPQKLPRAPLRYLTQTNQSLPDRQDKQWPLQDTPRSSEATQLLSRKTQWPMEAQRPLQETQWPPHETHSRGQETHSLPHGTELPTHKTQPLHKTQRNPQELPTFPWARRPSPPPSALATLDSSSVSKSYSYHDSVNVTVNEQTGEVSVVKVTIEKFKPGTQTGRLHPRQLNALLRGTSVESATGAGLKSFADPQPDDITFELYTRQHQDKYETLVATDVSSVKRSAFDGNKLTVLITHGFTGDADHSSWMHDMKEEFLKIDANVVLVQWANLSSTVVSWSNYKQAMKNVKFVGAETGKLLHLLRDAAQLSPDKLYLIGFSLGAHVVGFTGKAFPGIARITGLDPAGPTYDELPASERLDKSDANFVDVVHTNIELAGINASIGHVDFYVNGGETQPDCGFWRDLEGCSHYRAHELFISSLKFKDRIPKGFQCPNDSEYKAGKCLGNSFNNFGIQAQSSKPGDYYLDTAYVYEDDKLYSSGRLASQLLLQARLGQVPDKDLRRHETLQLIAEIYPSNHITDPTSTLYLTEMCRHSNPAGKHVAALATTPLQVPVPDLVIRLSYMSNAGPHSDGLSIQILSFVITDTTIDKRYSACNITVPSDEHVIVQFSDQECPSNGPTLPFCL